jgi:hypothetical protein
MGALAKQESNFDLTLALAMAAWLRFSNPSDGKFIKLEISAARALTVSIIWPSEPNPRVSNQMIRIVLAL